MEDACRLKIEALREKVEEMKRLEAEGFYYDTPATIPEEEIQGDWPEDTEVH